MGVVEGEKVLLGKSLALGLEIVLNESGKIDCFTQNLVRSLLNHDEPETAAVFLLQGLAQADEISDEIADFYESQLRSGGLEREKFAIRELLP